MKKTIVVVGLILALGWLIFPCYEEYQYQKWLDGLQEYDPNWAEVIVIGNLTIGNETYPIQMFDWSGPDVFIYTYNRTVELVYPPTNDNVTITDEFDGYVFQYEPKWEMQSSSRTEA